jgi:hypothetical protein
VRFNFKDTNATARNELWETYSDMFEKVFKVRPTVAYKQNAKYEDLVSFVITSNLLLGNTLDTVDIKEEVMINGLDFSPAV